MTKDDSQRQHDHKLDVDTVHNDFDKNNEISPELHQSADTDEADTDTQNDIAKPPQADISDNQIDTEDTPVSQTNAEPEVDTDKPEYETADPEPSNKDMDEKKHSVSRRIHTINGSMASWVIVACMLAAYLVVPPVYATVHYIQTEPVYTMARQNAAKKTTELKTHIEQLKKDGEPALYTRFDTKQFKAAPKPDHKCTRLMLANINECEQYKQNIANAIKEADALHETVAPLLEAIKASDAAMQYKDKVMDNKTIEAVTAAREKHDTYVNNGYKDVTVDDIKALTTELNDTAKKAEESNGAWKVEQARRARVAMTSGGYRQGSDGAWYVSYRGVDNRSYANADGSVGEWKDGYYIAHDWSSAGQQIASKPGTVVVNGRRYRYVSSMWVPQDATWEEVSGFVHANGGIGFQTCSNGGYLITHYEPI